jgi:Tol biopolymer transport system component
MRAFRPLLVALVALCALAASDAQAAFPGVNGRIAFGRIVVSGDQIFSVDPNGGSPTNLSNSPGNVDFSPVYSRDGSKIAFIRSSPSSEAVWVMNANGTGQHQASTPASGEGDLQPAFSPDGQKIVFERGAAGSELLFVVNVNGTGQHQLETPPAGSQDETPTWSPDGTKIAFMREPTNDSSGRITLINADGTGTATAISNPPAGLKDGDPNFSPDGSKVAFARSDATESSSPSTATDIFVVNTNGTGETNLTNAPNASTESEDPAFSPDGTMIVFAVNDAATNNFRYLAVMRADGSGKHPITPAVANQFDSSPNWQPVTPVLSGLRVAPKKASGAGRRVKGRCVKQTNKNKHRKPCRRNVKLSLSYTLNGNVGVTFKLTRKFSGRKVKGRCVRQTKKNRKHKRCTKTVAAGSFTKAGTGGANSFTLKRKLKPGSYVLTATPTGGASLNVTFKIVK